MTYYIKNGNTFRPTDENNVDIRTSLPVGNYVIKEDMFGNLFFETVANFEFKGKRYGDNPRQARRILDTFYARTSGTGIMLAGEKGSGKSLLAKTISMEAAKQETPTIIINAPWHGDKFNVFIQSIQQPAVILFDEFEKVYDAEQQEAILTLLDGVFPTQKLFVFTCNDKWRVDRHMRNRPGRIFYMIDFEGLDAAFIEEYCNDNLKAKQYIDKIVKMASLFSQFNFDMLKALVEEMNRYDESPMEAVKMLNVRPEYDEGKPTFNITMTRNGGEVVKTHEQQFKGNSLSNDITVSYVESIRPKEDDDDEEADRYNWNRIQFEGGDMKQMTSEQFTFEKNGLTLILNKKPVKDTQSWYDLVF